MNKPINNYTIQVCDIIEQIWEEGHPEETHSIFNINGINGMATRINQHIDYASSIIFQFDYTCYGDAEDKKNLERHILKSYYTRNINTDSVARWILFLGDRLDDIMPKYKALWEAQVKLLASDYLAPFNMTESKEGTIDTSKTKTMTSEVESSNQTSDNTSSNQSGNDSTTINNVNKFSNTPQALAQTGQDYLTSMTKDDTSNSNIYQSNNTSTNTANSTSNDSLSANEQNNELKAEDYVKIIKGNQGKISNGKLIKEYQDVILNIEKMITDELRDLFYLIY